MKTRYVILAALTIIVLAGCRGTVQVPANTIRFKSPQGSLDVTHPQDFTGTNLTVTIETNGSVTASFGYIRTANSPEVIDRASAGQVAIIKAQGEQAEKLIRVGMEAAEAGARKAVVP